MSDTRTKEADQDPSLSSPKDIYKSLKPQIYKTSRSPGKLTLNISKTGNLKLKNKDLTPATISLIQQQLELEKTKMLGK